MLELSLWQRLLLYAFILIALFIFVKVSQIKINGLPLVKLRYRILLALFFPILFVIFFLLGSFIIAIILLVLLIILLVYLLRRLARPKSKYL